MKFLEEFCISATAADEFRGTEVSVPAPCRDREVPPEPSPSVSIAVSAVADGDVDVLQTVLVHGE
jgi:hypothetical protein